MRLGLDLIYRLNPTFFSKNIENICFLIWSNKYDNQVLASIFQDLFYSESDVFKELVLDGQISNTVIQNKEKGILKRKNNNGSAQVRLEVVEKEKKEKVSEIQVNKRVNIIYNTCKM